VHLPVTTGTLRGLRLVRRMSFLIMYKHTGALDAHTPKIPLVCRA